MSNEPLVKQPTMMPTRKVNVGGANGASAVVGLNLLAMVLMERAYGGIENVPGSELQLIMWAVSALPVGWQYFWSWRAHEKLSNVQGAVVVEQKPLGGAP